MRNYALIIGILLLLGAFAAAWFLLQPNENQPTGTGNFEENLATLDNSDNPPSSVSNEEGDADKPNDPLSPARTDDQPADPEDAGPSQPAGEIIEGKPPAEAVTPGRDTTNPGGDGAEVEDPAAETAKPQKFIKGHKRPPGQNLGNTRPTSRRIGKPAGVKKLDDVSTKLRQDRRGLLASYASLQKNENGQWLPETNNAYTRIDREIWFPDAESFSDLPMPLDNFGATWTGFLVIETPGDYWFFLGADNGGRVELDGETVLLQDGMVRYVEVSAVLTLEPGLHPIKIEFAQQMNRVADAAKCAAAFMYVPDGQTKPVAVPPEMLMVPEWMWSDNAPIITSLSKTEGEIGDEITIRGQGFQGLTFDDGTGDVDTPPQVKFTNQSAEILSSTATELKVRVPIGARSGTLIVYGPAIQAGFRLPGKLSWIPSNSVEFKVTTQFGLIAQWHDLPGWSNYEFLGGDLHKPDVVRLERSFMFGERADINLEFRDDPLACSWDGKLGVPAESATEDDATWIEFQTHGRIRVTLGDVTKETGQELKQGDQLQTLRFEIERGEERYLLLSIDFTDESKAASLRIVELERTGREWTSESGKWADLFEEVRQLPSYRFFPPTVPPRPPEILNVKPLMEEGEQPTVPPYDAEGDMPSIRVGQEFSFELNDFGPGNLWLSKPIVTIDGVLLTYSVEEESTEIAGEHANRRLVCKASMPAGVGAGRMVAQISIVIGEPYFIDISNRGLVGYLYDVPEGSGLSKLPDLAPLTCFKVRKDRQINFESVADFDLPFPAETFVIEWLGGLIIEEEGDYEFICRSDDGMKLWLDDNVVIDADHPQAPAENTATVHLVPGVYRFRMQFFENNQHEVCVLEWRATRGEGEALEELIPRQVIPARTFSLDVHPAFPAKTSTGKRTDGS